MVGKSLKVKHKDSFQLSCGLYLHNWPIWPKLRMTCWESWDQTWSLMIDNMDSTLVTCTRGISNYHVRHYSDSDHAVQYCCPRDRERACVDSGISAVIHWFDNKSLSWTTWFHHFQAVADLQDGMMSIRWSSWYPILLSSPWLLSRKFAIRNYAGLTSWCV